MDFLVLVLIVGFVMVDYSVYSLGQTMSEAVTHLTKLEEISEKLDKFDAIEEISEKLDKLAAIGEKTNDKADSIYDELQSYKPASFAKYVLNGFAEVTEAIESLEKTVYKSN